MQVQESQDSQEPSQESPEPDPSQEQAPLDPEEQAAPESSEGEGELEAKDERPEGATEEEEKTPTETPEAKHKRKGGYERKIERLERQNQELVAALTARGGPAPVAPAAPKTKTPEEQAQEYIGVLVRQEAAALRAQEREAERQTEFRRRVDEVRAAHSDFDEALMSVSDVPTSKALQDALLTSDKPGEIMYQLAKNPAELARLGALPPLDAAREIGRLEAKLASGAAPQTPKPAARPPAPPSRVGGTASSTRSLETLPISDYKRAYRSGRR